MADPLESPRRRDPASPLPPTAEPEPFGSDASDARARGTSSSDPQSLQAFAVQLARLLRDDKCENVTLLDVRGRSQVTDYVLVGTGTSDRQMHAAMDHAEELGREHGFSAWRTNKDERSTWILIDFVDVVAHLFEPATRSYYDLEMMWGDAPRVDWRRAGEARDADATDTPDDGAPA